MTISGDRGPLNRCAVGAIGNEPAVGGSPAPCSTAAVVVISVLPGLLVPVGLLGALHVAARRWFRAGEGEHIDRIVFRGPVAAMSATLQLGCQSPVSPAGSRMRWWTETARSRTDVPSR